MNPNLDKAHRLVKLTCRSIADMLGTPQEESFQLVGSAMISEAVAAFAGAYALRNNKNIDTKSITMKLFKEIGEYFNIEMIYEDPTLPLADEHIDLPL